MTADIWTIFMKKLTQTEGKLDEFCNLSDSDIDTWLEKNNMGVTIDELVAASPKMKLEDEDLEKIAGGKIVLHSLLNTLQTEVRQSQRTMQGAHPRPFSTY